MSEKYEAFVKRLEENYPQMFSEPYGGVSIGEGWWPIVEKLCSRIQYHIDWKEEQRIKYNRGEGCTQVVVAQIKEKFGGLRFYYDGGDDYVQGLVSMAESWAGSTCEECGKPGRYRDGGWIRTLCDEHEAERQEKMKNAG